MKPSQLFVLLLHYISANRPVLIVGPPGCGKSDIVGQVAKKLKADFILMHPVVSDPTDVKGMPFVINGRAVWLPFGDLELMMNAKKLLIVFLDDLGQAPPMVQAAFMQLLLAREVNGQKISDHVVFIAATNDKNHMAGVAGILEPVKSRFGTIAFLEVDALDWIDWAIRHNVTHQMIQFIRHRPELLSKFEATADIRNTPSPRTVTFAAEALTYEMPKDLERLAIQGSVGEKFAIELYGYLRVYRDLPDFDTAIEHPRKVKMPETAMGNYAFAGMLGYYANDSNIKPIMKLVDRFASPEFGVQVLTIAQARNKKIKHNRPVINWLTDNQDIIT